MEVWAGCFWKNCPQTAIWLMDACSVCHSCIGTEYEEWKWVNRYYIGEVVGNSEIKLTEREKSVGMEARWLSLDEIMNIFHNTIYMQIPMRCEEVCIFENILHYAKYYRGYDSMEEMWQIKCGIEYITVH